MQPMSYYSKNRIYNENKYDKQNILSLINKRNFNDSFKYIDSYSTIPLINQIFQKSAFQTTSIIDLLMNQQISLHETQSPVVLDRMRERLQALIDLQQKIDQQRASIFAFLSGSEVTNSSPLCHLPPELRDLVIEATGINELIREFNKMKGNL